MTQVGEGRRLLARQELLLSVLASVGGRAGRTDFQKVLFWQCQSVGAAAQFDFVPYKFGPFSFTSYRDRQKLIELQYLVDDQEGWQLAPKGVSAAKPIKLVGLPLERGDALLRRTYREHPYYATRSEIAERVLRGDASGLERIAMAKPAKRTGLVTIGYEGLTVEAYLNQLLVAGVDLLCDVRRNPLSRKYGFSKSALKQCCEAVGIEYQHLPELGIASDERRALVAADDYDRLFAKYREADLPKQGLAVGQIAAWVTAGRCVALTCYERLPSMCHRHCVAEAAQSVIGGRSTVRHLQHECD